MDGRKWFVVPLALLAIGCGSLFADTVNFDALADNEVLTNQISGLLFTNSVAHMAGGTLNDADFPPRSFSNVLADYACDLTEPSNPICSGTGPISIAFSSLITDFSGFFTYNTMLTLQAFDGVSPVGLATSMFAQNFVSSGNSPNELIDLSVPGGFNAVTITGDPH